MSFVAYKIAHRASLQFAKSFAVTPGDLAAGFIHLSCKPELRKTALKFSGQENLSLLEIDLRLVSGKVIWVKKEKAYYPHLYGKITPKSVVWVKDLAWTGEKFDFPPGF